MPTSTADFTFLHGQWCRGSNIRRFNKRSRDECESHCRKADCVCFQYKDTPRRALADARGWLGYGDADRGPAYNSTAGAAAQLLLHAAALRLP